MLTSLKSWRKSIVPILLIQLFSFNAFSQEENLLPEINQSNGLESNAVRCIMLDAQGRVWTGTDNGISILNANNSVQKNIIAVVGNKSIWGINFLDSLVFIGSRFDGLFIFNQYTGKLIEQYPSTSISFIRKIKVFDKKIYILSNTGAFQWKSKDLVKLKFTESIKGDFPTDLFIWEGGLYALAYPTWDIIKYHNSEFEQNCTRNFIPFKRNRSLLCAKSSGNKLVIGGDGFYLIKETNKEPEIYSLPNSSNVKYAVWDILINGNKITLAIGDNSSSNKGILHVHGQPFYEMNESSYGFLTSMAYDVSNDCLYYGDLNRGLFLQKSFSSIVSINKPKISKLIANAKHVLFYSFTSLQRVLPNSKLGTDKVLSLDVGKKHSIGAQLFGDTLIVVYEDFIKLFNATSLHEINKIPIEQYGSGLMSMQLFGDNLYLFYNYSGYIFKVNLSNKRLSKTVSESFLPVTQKVNNRIIQLNKEIGFSFIEKDSSVRLSSIDKGIAFSEDFAIIKDNLYVLIKNHLKSYHIDFLSHQIIPLKKLNIDSTIEGFTAKWIVAKNDKLYLFNDKGILQVQQGSGLPLSYYYLGNYNQIDKPVISGDSLLITTPSMLTRIAFSDINKQNASIQANEVSVEYPKIVNENLGFSINLAYPDYLVQNHSLKYLILKKNGKLISKKYSINNSFNFTNGLKYGDYDLEMNLGNAQISSEINIILPLNRNPYFFGFIILFVLIIVLLLLKSLLDKKEFNKKLMRNRLQVLKQNLNPHFVFNSMNLISSLILEEKYDKAVEVVSEFSNLQRTYLETNNKNSITLKEELKFLDSYLKLQQTRFHYDNDFSYDINVSPGVDVSTIILPPLILQPLAENAVKYGVISSKAIQKKIWAEVKGKNPMIISIEDNGDIVAPTNAGLGLGQKLVQERIELFMHDHRTPILIFFGKTPLHSPTGYRVEVHVG